MVLYANWDAENKGNLNDIKKMVVRAERSRPKSGVEPFRGATKLSEQNSNELLQAIDVINSNLEGIISANEEDIRITEADYDEIDAAEAAVDAGGEGGPASVREVYGKALRSGEIAARYASNVETLGEEKAADLYEPVRAAWGAESDSGSSVAPRRTQSESGVPQSNYLHGGPIARIRDSKATLNHLPRDELLQKAELIGYQADSFQTDADLIQALQRSKSLPLVKVSGKPARRAPKQPDEEPRSSENDLVARLPRSFGALPGLLSPIAPSETSAQASETPRFPPVALVGEGMMGGASADYLHLYKSVVTILASVASAKGAIRRLDMRSVPESVFEALRKATRHMNDLSKEVGSKNKLTLRIANPLRELYASLIQKLVTYPNAELGNLTGGEGMMPARTTFGPPSMLGSCYDPPRRWY